MARTKKMDHAASEDGPGKPLSRSFNPFRLRGHAIHQLAAVGKIFGGRLAHFEARTPGTDIQYAGSNIQHPTSNIQRSSNIQFPNFGGLIMCASRGFDLSGCWCLDLFWMLDVGAWKFTACLRRPILPRTRLQPLRHCDPAQPWPGAHVLLPDAIRICPDGLARDRIKLR